MDYASWIFNAIKNETRLKLFYCSGEPETTQNYKFIDMNIPVTMKLVSGCTGLGMFLREPATAGQLLLVSNAKVSCACVHDSAPYSADSYIHSPKATWKAPDPRVPSEVHEHLLLKLLTLLSTADEDLREKIFDLHTKPFCNISETNNPLQFRGESDIEPVEEQLSNIIVKNAFCDKVRRLDPNKPSRVESFEMWGLWLLPSYINHSCTPNCHRMRVGDAVFIRAAKDIAAGEELTLPYFDIFEPLCVRSMMCELHKFRCHCSRCSFERSIGEPYDSISVTLFKAMVKLQAIWSDQGLTYVDQSQMFLFQLAALEDPATLLEEHVSSDRKNEGISSAQHESGSNICPEILDLEDFTRLYWIRASFIDMHISFLTLALTKSCLLEDSLLSEESRFKRIAEAASRILNIIDIVHPGNMLGQEISLMSLKGLRTRLAEFSFREDVAAQLNDIVQQLEHVFIPQFFQCYYGFPGEEALKLLLATES